MNNELGKIKFESIPMGKLIQAPYNPRMISERAKQGLSNSIDTFGLLQPIVWNRRTGHIISGHQRYNDLMAKGVLETDVIVVDFDEAKEKAANIAMNHTGISGQFDEDKLQELLGEIDSGYIEALNFEELKLPEWEPLPEVSEDEYNATDYDKLVLKVYDKTAYGEIKNEIERLLLEHFDPGQASFE